MGWIRDPPLPYPGDWDEVRSPARPSQARETNTRDVLRLLRRHAPCSRADLVRLSGLSAPTVSAAIAWLHRKGIVEALGPGASSGGRPPGLLQFNARSGFVVGVDIGGSTVRVALADLDGHVAGRWDAAIGEERDPSAVVARVNTGVSQLLRREKIAARKILHIVAGAPGITNVDTGTVISAPNLSGWHNVPLRGLLRRKTGFQATIENDVNLGALGEHWCGAARDIRNFVFLAIGTGVGAGIVLNDALHRGANWSAGEVGYMMLPGLRPDPPTTDQPGALEAVIGGQGIERCWLHQSGSQPLRATEVFERALTGDLHANELLNRAADLLAMAITNLSLTLDLSLVVLSGGVGAHAALLDAIQQRLECHQFARPQLAVTSLHGEASLYGAIYLALQQAESRLLRRIASNGVSQPAARNLPRRPRASDNG
ncbi:MAG TPA: ROK family transcriptional regulator [Bryobacteraceae bacterium]|jgi:glucokinase